MDFDGIRGGSRFDDQGGQGNGGGQRGGRMNQWNDNNFQNKRRRF